jgi:hypothetical protein
MLDPIVTLPPDVNKQPGPMHTMHLGTATSLPCTPGQQIAGQNERLDTARQVRCDAKHLSPEMQGPR